MSRTENAARNIIWGMLNKVITLALPFLTRTLFIYTLGTLYLGLNGLFTSILQVLNITELGINSAITFSMYQPLAEGNTEEVNALLSFYRKCYRIIGIIVIGLGLVIIGFLPYLISGNVPEDINIYLLYLIYLIGTFLSYELFAYRTALLVAQQRNDIVSKVSTILTILQFSFQVFILVIVRNYYLYIIANNLTSILNNIICAAICKKMYPYYYCKGKIPKDTYDNIKKKIKGMIFQKIGGVVLTSVDSIVISAFLGLQTLAVYQNYYFIITSLFGILAVIMTSITATVGNSIVMDSIEKNYRDFRKFNFLYVWIDGWCAVCLLCLYQPFIEIWVGKELLLPYYMVVLFALYFFTHKWCDMLYVYQEACGIWWETRWVPICAAMANLLVNLVLVNIIGLAGILLSTIVSVVFIYDVGYANVLFKVYFSSRQFLVQFIRNQIYYMVGVIIAAGASVLICHILSFKHPLVSFLANACVCIIVPNMILVIFFRIKEEYKEAITFAKQLLNKKVRRLK